MYAAYHKKNKKAIHAAIAIYGDQSNPLFLFILL
jgi:hypothetical protein